MMNLPKHILNALKDNKTSLGEHPCFPPEEEEKFTVFLLSKTFEEFCENVNDIEIDYDTLKNELGKLLSQCEKIERNNRQALEKLCINIVNELFHIPEQSINIEAKLVDKIDTSIERLIPEKTSDDFSFEDIEDMNNLTDEIYKRRMLNALVTGAAMFYTNNITSYVRELFDINSDLPSLYKKVLDYNNVLLFLEKVSFNEEKMTNGGKVDVTISSSDSFPIIKSEGLIFPILMEETIKGLLELAISHGLPQKIDKAKYVMSKADFKLAEMWDMRMGYSLWKIIEDETQSCGYNMLEIGINFFLMSLSEMDCKTFNNSLKEIFAKTKKGKKIINEICEEILYNKEQDEFNDYIQTKNNDTIIINDDDYFSPEELMINDDEYFTSEELINDSFQIENQNLNEATKTNFN